MPKEVSQVPRQAKLNAEMEDQTILSSSVLDKVQYAVTNDLKMPCERIGEFLWVDCTSNEMRPKLEQLGFRFSVSRFLWYYTTKQYDGTRSRRMYSMDEMRRMFTNNGLIVR